LRHGREVEVLSPKVLRKKIGEQASLVKKLYD